jgi:hypothetical protein
MSEQQERKPYTLIGLYLDHPSAVGEIFVKPFEGRDARDFELTPEEENDENGHARAWSIVVILAGHVTPAYNEKLV